MTDDDVGVAVARWECDAAVGAIATVRQGVNGFARRYGMRDAAREDLRAAVSEAVADAVSRAGVRQGGHSVVVDAATDGAWLSVRVIGAEPARSATAPMALPLVAALADRVEWDPGGAEGTRVLMEFALAPAPPQVAAWRTCGRRVRRRPRVRWRRA